MINIILAIIQLILLIITYSLVNRLLTKQGYNTIFNYFKSKRKDCILPDPHHGNKGEWRFYKDKFYQRRNSTEPWIESKHVHLTPERVVIFYKLLEIAYKKGQITNIDYVNSSNGSTSVRK